MKHYTPTPKQNLKYRLASATVARERRIHELQVRYTGVSIAERKQICEMQKWKPEEVIPELTSETRVAVSALQKMVDRNENSPEKTHQELAKLAERFASEQREIEPISSAEYWHGMACVLFQDFDTKTNPDELIFGEIQEAYSDFFGL